MATIRQTQYTYAYAYAMTFVTFQRHPHFQRTANADLFITTLFRYRDADKFRLHAFAVMPDHIHILITPAMNKSTARCVQLIKSGYSFAARDHSSREIWQSGHHEHRVRDEDDYQNQRLYIDNNPLDDRRIDYPHVHTAAAYASILNPAPFFTPQPAAPNLV